MSKHKRLKPVREYLYDKGEMIEQMFSSIPIVEIRNMVPIKLQGMPLHELKAECLVELLEMSDREILSILDGKKTRDPSSSESEAGGVVVISDDERRIKKENRTDPAVARREDSDGNSPEWSISGKKKNKRKSKEFDTLKRSKKKKVDAKQPVPSTSKEVATIKEITKKKRSARPPEKPKPPPGEVVILDDDSSDNNESSNKTGEKSLLDLLELEMRARAIRSLLKKEEETQALKVLSEYKDEPDDLIPVEISPPQVDLLSDSDEDLEKEEPIVQPSPLSGIQMEVEGDDALSLKDSDVLDTLLGIENKEHLEVVEVVDIDDSVDLLEVKSHEKDEVICKNAGNTRSTVRIAQNPETSVSHAESVEGTDSQSVKTRIEDPDVTVKVESGCFDVSKVQKDVPTSPKQLDVIPFKILESSTTSNIMIVPTDSDAPPCVLQVGDDKLVGTGRKEAYVTVGKVSKSSALPLSTEPPVLPVECTKPLLKSLCIDFHANLEEDVLDYDYDPSLPNVEKQGVYCVSTSTIVPQGEPPTNKSDGLEETLMQESNKFGGDETIQSQTAKMVDPGVLDQEHEKYLNNSKKEEKLGSVDDQASLSCYRSVDGPPAEAELPSDVINTSGDGPSSVSKKMMHADEEAPSPIDGSDRIQAEELRNSQTEKTGLHFDVGNDSILSDLVNDQEVNSSEKHHNFLVYDALGSTTVTTPRLINEGQEHNATITVVPPGRADKQSSRANQDLRGKLSNLEANSPPLENEPPTIVTERPDPPEHDEHVLGGGGDSQSERLTNISFEKEPIHFLADDALESSDTVSLKLTMMSQEHKGTDSTTDSQQTDVENVAYLDNEELSNQKESNRMSDHKSLEQPDGETHNFDSIISRVENELSFLDDSKQLKQVRDVLQQKVPVDVLASCQLESPADTSAEPNLDRNKTDPKTVSRRSQKSKDYRQRSYKNHSQPSDHECLKIIAENQALSISSMEKDNHDSFEGSQSELETNDILADKEQLRLIDNRAFMLLPKDLSPRSVMKSPKCVETDLSIDNVFSLLGHPVPANRPSPKSENLFEELSGSSHSTQDVDYSKEEAVSSRSTQQVQQVLVEVNNCKVREVNREQNEVPLVAEDVLDKVDTLVDMESAVTQSERKEGGDEEPMSCKKLLVNNKRNVGRRAIDLLKCESVCTHEGLGCKKVNDEMILQEDGDAAFVVPDIRVSSLELPFVLEAVGSACSTSDLRSVFESNPHPFSDHCVTAVVDSVETAKKIPMVNGKAVRTPHREFFGKDFTHQQAVSLSNMDFIIVSSEDENESCDVADCKEESSGYCFKVDTCSKVISPASDALPPFSQCESSILNIREESQINRSCKVGRDVITSTDQYSAAKTEQKIETVTNQEDRYPELGCTSSSSVNQNRSSLLVGERTVVLGTENNNSEIYEMNVSSSMVNGELTTDGSGCEGTLNYGLSCASSASSTNTRLVSFEPLQSPLITEDCVGVNNNSAVIVINDEDSGGICREENLLGIKCSEEKPSKQEDFYCCTKNRRTKVETGVPGNSDTVEIEEESVKSSSETEETTIEDSDQSEKSCVHIISDDDDDDDLVLTRLNKNVLSSPGKTEIDSGSISKEEAKIDEQPSSMLRITTQLFAKCNSSSEQLVIPACATAQQKILDGIIDISGSESGDSLQAGSLTKQAVTCCNQGSMFFICNDNCNQNKGASLSALPRDVSCNTSDEMPCSSISKKVSVCHNSDVDGIQSVDSKEIGECHPAEVPSLPDLEEGEIVDSDSLVENSEDEGSQNKYGVNPKIPLAQRRSHGTIASTWAESDDCRISSCRSKRQKLRRKRRKTISEQIETLNSKKYSEGGKYQDATINSRTVPQSATLEFDPVPKIMSNVSKLSSDRMDGSDTIVIEDDDDDDEEIVQAITKEMPPEILELDDSDETETNWTARWLESSHVKKVVTTSKILTNARKKLKMKLRVKEIPEVDAASPSVDVPQLIGSVEEYHRLVREGVITSSSKPVVNKDLGKGDELGNEEAKSNDVVPLNSSADKRSDNDVGRENSTDEVSIMTTRNKTSCDLSTSVVRTGKEPEEVSEKSDSAELITESDILLPVASEELSTTHPGLTGDTSNENSTSRMAVDDEVLMDGRNASIVEGCTSEADGSGKCSLKKSADCDPMVQVSFPQPPVSVTMENSDKSSVLVNTDSLNSSIKHFHEITSPNQVIGNVLSLQSLSDIPYQLSDVGTDNKTVPTQLSKSPVSAVCSTTLTPAESNVSNINESSAFGLVSLYSCHKLEGGETEHIDNEIVSNNNDYVARPNSSLITSITTNLRYSSDKHSSHPVSGSSCGNCSSKSIRSVIPEPNIVPVQFKPVPGGQSAVPENAGFDPLPTQLSSSSPNISCATPVFQCPNILGSSSRMHSTFSTVSHSSLSSVIPPSYTMPEATATPLLVDSASQNPSVQGVQDALLPMNPIQAATAGISSIHQFGGPSTSLVHPQMSVNVNSMLHMYDPYYSWVYSQGLSGSLNSSYGYATPDASKDPGTIYKQWGEYYRKLMEACQDSAIRASAKNMFLPVSSDPVDNKGYSWVFERLNQSSLVSSNPETSNVVSTNAEPVQNQDPGRDWNYRYGLKGLLGEHFVAPGTAPPPTASSNSLPHGLSRRLSRRGKRKKKR